MHFLGLAQLQRTASSSSQYIHKCVGGNQEGFWVHREKISPYTVSLWHQMANGYFPLQNLNEWTHFQDNYIWYWSSHIRFIFLSLTLQMGSNMLLITCKKTHSRHQNRSFHVSDGQSPASQCKGWAQLQGSTCGICGAQSGTGTGSPPPRYLDSPC